MVRRLFNAASAVSLLLCAATAVLWERSYRHSDGFSFWTSRGFLELASRRGDFVLDNQPQQELDRGTPIAMIGPQAVARNAAGQRPSHKAPQPISRSLKTRAPFDFMLTALPSLPSWKFSFGGRVCALNTAITAS
jgi:hypothetical protein